MYSLSIQVEDKATSLLRALDAGMATEEINALIGESGKQVVVNHLLDLASSRHRADARFDFYGEAAAATTFVDSDAGAIISINKDGIAQRYFGGRIEPDDAARLAIPARSEAVGKRPKEFSNLQVVFFRETMALVERESSDIRITKDRRKGKQGQLRIERGQERGGVVMFWLVESVDQGPDTSVLPDPDDLLSAVYDRLDRHVGRLFGEGGQ